MKRVSLLAAALMLVASAQADTVIRNGTILTISGAVIERGSVLIRDGKIAAVGESVEAPADATVIDGEGLYVMPGIIDCHSHMAADSINEGAIPVSSMVAIEDVLNPEDPTIYRALAGGVTTANVLHGSANPIGGQCAVIKLRWGRDAKGLLFKGAKPGIKFALGENPKRSNSTTPNLLHPTSRQGVNDVIRQAFLDAKKYRADWQAYERLKAQGKRAIPPRRDLQLEPLLEVLDGKRLVHAHCYRADEILALLRLADEIGFKIRTLQHVLEGYKVAPEIAAHGAGASTFSDWWSYKIEAADAIPYNAALMTRAGIVVSINSDSGEEVRHLNQEAAKTIKWGGLSQNEALRLVTLNPAIQLQIDDLVGSIEVGKQADLAIWEGHPLSVYARVVTTFVDGEIYFDRARDLEQREKLAERKRVLVEREKASKKAADKAREPSR